MRCRSKVFISIITLIFSALNLGLSAQHQIFVSLNSGISLPVGSFAGTSLNKDSFAKPGVSFGAEAIWFFHSNLGVGVEANVNNNPLDVTALTEEKFIADPFLEELSVRSESFRTTTLSAGIYGKYELSTGFTVHGKLLAGFMRCHTPYQLYRTQYYLVGPTYYEITSSRNDAVVVIPGVGIQYLFARGIGFKLDGEFQSKKMSFPFQTSHGLEYSHRTVSYFHIMLSLVIGI